MATNRPISETVHDRARASGQRFDSSHRQILIVNLATLVQVPAMRFVVAIASLLWLSGCQPVRTFYAEGAHVDVLARDNTACDVIALRDAPVANEVRQGAPYYVPRRYCHKGGRCYNDGFWVPGDVYTVDVNRDLRRRVKTHCMADLGYAPVEIPRCPYSIANAAPPGETTVLPRLTENSCVILNDDGSFQIVKQG